ncbi:carboxymuconolactone decarboxylase family protein [Ruegeria sp. 2205SS24-7]|uniref:carboxymuconolactone decarboxylase family protein n=1 Tax=Ruegeria discodermiae TaxID=3064389 RepID=UPI002741BB3E|nr:carboxymuconolactone decarboxylase family protein [Ruegeria sp. 2205SS24-7]MDP5215808.1 carboxymuconolactone decarboxylase family protein [Ruegeria sp. 2205SS24-7]
MEPRLKYWAEAPELIKAFVALNDTIEGSGLDKTLMHLVKLRASQINGCAFCIDMHTREARADGETEQRLYLVSAWHDSFLYSDRERAALQWTEALTRLADHAPDDALFAATQAQFPGEEIVKLTAIITMINTWNRLSVAFRAVHAAPRPEAA